MPPSATSPMGTPRVRSGPFGLDCSAAMTFGIVVHCRPLNLRKGGAGGHERTSNSFDLFRFQSWRARQDARSIVSGLPLIGRGPHLQQAFFARNSFKAKGAACTAPLVALTLRRANGA